MKVAVSATENHLDALLDPLFGRCRFFIIVDTDDMSFEAFDNTNIAVDEDAGINAAGFVASKGVDIVLTGNCGPKAFEELSKRGIKIILKVMGTVRQVVETYRTGRLLTTGKANVNEHFGKRTLDASESEKNQSHNDSGHQCNAGPWYGYVRFHC